MQCAAFTYNGTCGSLKASGVPRVKRPGVTSVVFSGDDVITAAEKTTNTTGGASAGQGGPYYVNASAGGSPAVNGSGIGSGA
jgi:hypothetical protein